MAGGKARPKKDTAMKVSNGMLVKTGQILSRGIMAYKRGVNVGGLNTLYARCCGKVYFTKKKTSHGKFRTFINVAPVALKSAE